MELKSLASKKVAIPLALLLVVGIVSAAVWYNTTHVDVTVNEALSTTDVAFTAAAYPGETIEQTITVHNAANVPLNTELSWTETEGSNVNGTAYTTDMPKTMTLAPGADTAITVHWYVEADSPIGPFAGDITLTRTK